MAKLGIIRQYLRNSVNGTPREYTVARDYLFHYRFPAELKIVDAAHDTPDTL